MIDAAHWDKLCRTDPRDVSRRSLAQYDEQEGVFRLNILTDEIVVNPKERSVTWSDPARNGGKPPSFHHWLVSVVYLLSASKKPPAGRWVKAEALPYGEFFFRGPHELPTARIADAFDDRQDRFSAAARALAGEPWPLGRNAFVLPGLPKVPILVQFWERDEEFPARAGFLFDRDTCDHLPIDAAFSLVTVVAVRLIEADKEI